MKPPAETNGGRTVRRFRNRRFERSVSRTLPSSLLLLEALALMFLLFLSLRFVELLTLLLALLPSSPVASLLLSPLSSILAALLPLAHRGLLDGAVLALGATAVLVLLLLLRPFSPSLRPSSVPTLSPLSPALPSAFRLAALLLVLFFPSLSSPSSPAVAPLLLSLPSPFLSVFSSSPSPILTLRLLPLAPPRAAVALRPRLALVAAT